MRDLDQEMRNFLIQKPFEIAAKYDFIKSINIVGSFAENSDLTGISDIDTVIIVDHLDKWKYQSLIKEFKDFSKELKTRFNYDLVINDTFGPIKFNKDKTVVYHLMVYDIASHIEHCRKSPFTCFDWQRTKHMQKRIWEKSTLSILLCLIIF